MIEENITVQQVAASLFNWRAVPSEEQQGEPEHRDQADAEVLH